MGFVLGRRSFFLEHNGDALLSRSRCSLLRLAAPGERWVLGASCAHLGSCCGDEG